MEVKYISKTHSPQDKTPEHLMARIARVSNPASDAEKQEMPPHKLLKYCLDHEHWSVFEMCDFTVEIRTSRAISAQILRHRSFTFQEFSQRYSRVTSVEKYRARRQDYKDRQSSIDDLTDGVQSWFANTQEELTTHAIQKYNEALLLGISKESARFILPTATTTTLYMKGSVRSWIHYLALRSDKGTQLEHQEIALAILNIFIEHFPITSKALGWI